VRAVTYVRAVTAAGFATLPIDRLGTGASSHPPVADVTATSGSFALHQVIQQLRAGRAGGNKQRRSGSPLPTAG
jgi:hypothetical protein